jgi:hypothetical protein
MTMFNQYVSPWLLLTDDRRFQATVDRVEALGASAIVGCHNPVIPRELVDVAIETTRRSPSATVAPMPEQELLDEIQLQLLGS